MTFELRKENTTVPSQCERIAYATPSEIKRDGQTARDKSNNGKALDRASAIPPQPTLDAVIVKRSGGVQERRF